MTTLPYLRMEDRLRPILDSIKQSGFLTVTDVLLAILKEPQPGDRTENVPIRVRSAEISKVKSQLSLILQAVLQQSEDAVDALGRNTRLCHLILPIITSRIQVEAAKISTQSKSLEAFTSIDIVGFNMASLDKELRSSAPMLFALLQQAFNLDRPEMTKPYLLATAISVLTYGRNRKCNYFQGCFGYFLLAANTGKRTVTVMSRIGLSVSFESLHRMQKAIATSIIKEYQQLARIRPWIISYDNMNYKASVKNQLLHKTDHMQNDTAGYIYFPCFEEDPIPKYHLREDSVDRLAALTLNQADLTLTKQDINYYRVVAKAIIFDVLDKYFPSFKSAYTKPAQKGGRDKDPPEYPRIHLIPLGKTAIYTLPTLDLNEARIDDTISIITTFLENIGVKANNMHDKVAMLKGDYLTVRNANIAMFQRQDADSRDDTLDYLEPVTGLFHTNACMQSIIIKAYWGKDKEPGSLSRMVNMSRNNRVKEKNKDFRAGRYFINQALDGHILAACFAAADKKLEQGMGPHITITFDRFKELTESKVTYNWDAIIDEVVDKVYNLNYVRGKRYDLETLDPIPLESRDPANENALLFIRDALSLRDYQHAIRAGDTGRIIKILQYWCIILQSTPNTNYAAELIHLVACFKKIWKKPLVDLWLRNCLVNPSGREGGWLECDLFGEYVIRENKARIKPSTNSASDDHNRTVNAVQVMLY